jgi:hypothetical protein
VAGWRSLGGLHRAGVSVWRAWAFVRSWVVQIAGAPVVGVAGRSHQHTQTLDSSGTRERVNPHKVYP